MKSLGAVFALGVGYVHSLDKPTHEILPNALKSMFRITFVDSDTNQPLAQSTGFFISASGLGLASGLALDRMKGSKHLVSLSDNTLVEAEGTVINEMPGLGFVQIQQKPPAHLKVSYEDIQDGAFYHAAGTTGEHPFFKEFFVSNNNYRWTDKRNNDEIVHSVVLMTPGVPSECIGGPVLNEHGNAIGLIFNITRGLPLVIPLKRLREIAGEDKKEWRVVLAWRRTRESIYRWLNQKAN